VNEDLLEASLWLKTIWLYRPRPQLGIGPLLRRIVLLALYDAYIKKKKRQDLSEQKTVDYNSTMLLRKKDRIA